MKVVQDYQIGILQNHEVIFQGYEDFNVKLTTTEGIYLAKVFANFRSVVDCKQYVDIMTRVTNAGISHPKLFKGSQGFMHTIDNSHLCLMEYIDGDDFFHLQVKPTRNEMIFLTQQAAKINTLDIKPTHIYDSWAIPNFLKEYEKVSKQLDEEDIKLIKPLAENFVSFGIDELPHAFVHGDIIATNVIRSKMGQLFIIDFAVSNWYPRIQEIAILLCDLFFIEDEDKFMENYNLVLEEYQKILSLERSEIDILPNYIKLAHAMHIVPATREKMEGNELPENEFWLKSGQKGLRFVNQIWK